MADIYNTLVAYADADGTLYRCDTIRHEGKFWLVPHWLEERELGRRRPARIVCLDPLKHQKSSMKGIDFLVNDPVPKAVFDGQVPPGLEALYVVIEEPAIYLPIPTAH